MLRRPDTLPRLVTEKDQRAQPEDLPKVSLLYGEEGPKPTKQPFLSKQFKYLKYGVARIQIGTV